MTTSTRKSLLLLTGIILSSRLLFYLAGVRFSTIGFDCFYQFADTELLRHDLLRSLIYMHGQPPLFNLGIGLVLKLFPGYETTAFALIWLLTGLLMAWSMVLLMVRLGILRNVAMVATVIFIAGPQSILYENWLYYTYPVAALLALAALCLHRYLSSSRFRDGIIFFGLLASVILTRSLFHLVWMVAAIVLVAWCRRVQWRQVVAAATLPLLLVLALYTKNMAITGSFASSTWMGMSLARKATFLLPEETRKAEVAAGQLSPLALIGPFSGLSAYAKIPYARTQTGVPLLDQESKSAGCLNMHHLAYAELSRGYFSDALSVIRNHPQVYAKGCALGLFTYVLPSSNYYYLDENRRMIPTYERIYNLIVFGQPMAFDKATVEEQAEGYLGRKLLTRGWFLVIGLPILFWYGFRRARRATPSAAGASTFSITMYFLLGTIAYVTIVGNAIEIAENNRFRYTIEPYIAVLAVLALTRLWQRVRKGGAAALHDPAPSA